MISRNIIVLIVLLAVISIGVATIINVFIAPILIERKPVTNIGRVEKTNITIVLKDDFILLPYPMIRRDILSTEESIAYRRSIRDYKDEPISIEHLSQLLWATYGISETRWGLKTTPSAGATYPLEIYVVVGERKVSIPDRGYLKPGIYKYHPYTHSLKLIREGDYMEELSKAAVNQRWVKEAAINIVICAVYERTTRVYGERGYRYVYMEVGHAGQNIYLEATALNLGAVVIGAFYDDWVKDIIKAEKDEHPLYLVSIGVPKEIYRVSEDEIARYIDSKIRERGLI